MIFVPDGAWFRFKSHNLGQAIFTFLTDPSWADIAFYRPFLVLLQNTQDAKNLRTLYHRTMNMTATVVLPQDERDKVATRFATLVADEFEILKEALTS